MKNLTKSVISVLIILMAMSTVALAEEPIKVSVNGEIINFDNPPVIKDERTLVPVRKIFEALDATVRWDDTTKTVFGYIENTMITLPLNSNTAKVRTDETSINTINLDVPAQIIQSRTYVPVRFIGEAAGADVKWDGETKTVVITKEKKKNIQKFEYEDGYYEGEVKDGNYNGYGKYVWNTGDSYEGNWVNGVIHGQGTYTWASGDSYTGKWENGEMTKGTFTKANGEVFKIGEEAQAQATDNGVDEEFKEKAMNGVGYDELMKNSKEHIGEAAYFEGSVVEILEADNNTKVMLVDTSAFINSFIDMNNQFGDYKEEIQLDNIESTIVAVSYTGDLDIQKQDYVKVYGNVTEKVSYEDIYGITYTVPAIELVEHKRNKRASEYIDEIYNGDYKTIDEKMRGE